MLCDDELGRIAAALEALRSGAPGAMPWTAVDSLGELSALNIELTIDYRASKALGAPLLLARRPHSAPSFVEKLSARGRQVAQCLCQGLSNKAIARALGIGVGTVKDHVHRILTKTGSPSRAAFAARSSCVV